MEKAPPAAMTDGPGRRRRRGAIAASMLAACVVASAIPAAILSTFRPGGELGGDATGVAAAAIFIGSYLALAIGKIPGLGIDRAGIALVGAALMVAAGALTPAEAYRAIDLDTITLLLGIMIVVANLRPSGFFGLATAWLTRHAGRSLILLAAIVVASGLFSAFLVNDAICVILTPLVLELTRWLKRPPIPYLLAVAMASNIGSTATITGNPQNILIGSFSQLPYLDFAAALAPVAAIGLVLTVALIALACGLADPGDGLDLGRELHPCRLDRQPDRRAECGAARRQDRLLGLFCRRRTPDRADYRHRHAVAIILRQRRQGAARCPRCSMPATPPITSG